jgi:2-oxoacid:acceptor oxidoreductase delta subunit (pyruvate/2-ketoisovalerate family)
MSQTDNKPRRQKTILGPCALIFCSAATGTWRVVRPVVNRDSCILCGICEKHCPTGVMTTGEKEKDGRVEIDFKYCKGCGICAEVCPKNSIDMVDERQV